MSRRTLLISSLAGAVALVLLGALVTELSTPEPPPSPGPPVAESRATEPPVTGAVDPARVAQLEERGREYRARLDEANRRLRDQQAALDEARHRLERASGAPGAATRRDRGAEHDEWDDDERDEDDHDHHRGNRPRGDHRSWGEEGGHDSRLTYAEHRRYDHDDD